MDQARNPSLPAHPGVGPGPHRQRSAVRLQQHLSHWPLLYAMSAIAAGLAVNHGTGSG